MYLPTNPMVTWHCSLYEFQWSNPEESESHDCTKDNTITSTKKLYAYCIEYIDFFYDGAAHKSQRMRLAQCSPLVFVIVSWLPSFQSPLWTGTWLTYMWPVVFGNLENIPLHPYYMTSFTISHFPMIRCQPCLCICQNNATSCLDQFDHFETSYATCDQIPATFANPIILNMYMRINSKNECLILCLKYSDCSSTGGVYAKYTQQKYKRNTLIFCIISILENILKKHICGTLSVAIQLSILV